MARTIFAFNGDLESRLALHWLVHERGGPVLAVSLDVGQGIYLEPLGEIALKLGASSSLILDRRSELLNLFALRVLQAGAVYQGGCSLGSALFRYLIAKELVRIAHEEGANRVAHSRLARATTRSGWRPLWLPSTLAWRWWSRPGYGTCGHWRPNSITPAAAACPGGPSHSSLSVDRNLWSASLYYYALPDPPGRSPSGYFCVRRSPQRPQTSPRF